MKTCNSVYNRKHLQGKELPHTITHYPLSSKLINKKKNTQFTVCIFF